MKKKSFMYAAVLASAAFIPAIVTQAEEVVTIADGTYDVKFLTYKTGTTEISGMANRFGQPGKLIVENGNYALQLNIINQNQLLHTMYIPYNGQQAEMNTIEGSPSSATRIVQLPIEKLDTAITVEVEVMFPGSATPVVQTFDLIVDAPNTDALTEQVKLQTFKLNSYAQSSMQHYIEPTANLLYELDKTIAHITFTDKSFIKGFSVNEKEATVIDEQDKAITYAVEIDNPKLLQVATMKLSYNGQETVQQAHLHFGVKGAPVMVENPFKDIADESAQAAILNLYSKNIVKASEHFYPQQAITREHYALMIARTLNLQSDNALSFTDTNTLSGESQSAISALVEAGIVKKGAHFYPNVPIQREHAALIIYRAMQYHVGTDALDFGNNIEVYTDAHLIPSKESQRALSFLYVSNAYIGEKTSNEQFAHPTKSFTRAEIATLLNNTLKYLGH
jgi:heme-binding NEAT domain protein